MRKVKLQLDQTENFAFMEIALFYSTSSLPSILPSEMSLDKLILNTLLVEIADACTRKSSGLFPLLKYRYSLTLAQAAAFLKVQESSTIIFKGAHADYSQGVLLKLNSIIHKQLS